MKWDRHRQLRFSSLVYVKRQVQEIVTVLVCVIHSSRGRIYRPRVRILSGGDLEDLKLLGLESETKGLTSPSSPKDVHYRDTMESQERNGKVDELY